MTTDQYLVDIERRLKKLEGNDAFRDSETKAIRKLAESAERQVRFLEEPIHALRSYLDRFHAAKPLKNTALQESESAVTQAYWLMFIASVLLGAVLMYAGLVFAGWLK